jgi:hypothetical protein
MLSLMRSNSSKAIVKVEATRAPVPATASKLLRELHPLLPEEISKKTLSLLNIVVIGIQDAGKSSTINNIMGVAKLMPTAHGNRSTKITTRISVVPGAEGIEIRAPRPGGQKNSELTSYPLTQDFTGIVQKIQDETIEAFMKANYTPEQISKKVELNIRSVSTKLFATRDALVPCARCLVQSITVLCYAFYP